MLIINIIIFYLSGCLVSNYSFEAKYKGLYKSNSKVWFNALGSWISWFITSLDCVDKPKKKYVLTDITKIVDGKTLYRIKAVKDFNDVRAGDLGGYIQHEFNLSQRGNCWLYNESCAYDYSQVKDDAIMRDYSMICEQAVLRDKAYMNCHSKASGMALISDDSYLTDYAHITDFSQLHNNCNLGTRVTMFGKSSLQGSIAVRGDVTLAGATLTGDFYLRGNFTIKKSSDILVFKNNWSSHRTFIFIRPINQWHIGCFRGTDEELITKAYEDSRLSGKCYENTVHYKNLITHNLQVEK